MDRAVGGDRPCPMVAKAPAAACWSPDQIAQKSKRSVCRNLVLAASSRVNATTNAASGSGLSWNLTLPRATEVSSFRQAEGCQRGRCGEVRRALEWTRGESW